ncbi:MAG: RraA family protein [Rhodospirillales bacterium]|nr:RraA family protein [Rhodospirillales bacterium]
MKYEEEIIRFIKSNRVSTTEVADALGKTGVLPGLSPFSMSDFRVGKVRPVFTANNSNYAIHEQIRNVEEGEVVIIFTHNCDGRASIGDIISKFILLYRGAEGLVVDGMVRDGARLHREGYAVWSSGVSPLGCFNTPADPFPTELEAETRAKVDGGIAVCDGGGVVVIPPDRLNADMLDRLEKIEIQEDIWYYCLDSLKWDTKQIVCDREYLNQPDLLPLNHRESLARLETRLDADNDPSAKKN